MKLKGDSIHTLPEPTGLHRLSPEDRLLNRAQRGKLSHKEATELVVGTGKAGAQELSEALTRRAKKELK